MSHPGKKKSHWVALLCRDDSTRTSDPYVPNVVRYQLRYIPKKNKPLGELVDVNLETALEVGSLVLVDDSNLCKLVYHCVDLGCIFLGLCFVCYITKVADRVPCGLCIILVMQAVTLTLTSGTRGGFCVCHYVFFLYFGSG